MVDVIVTDQGVGIPAVELDRIFERFYRVDPARARATGGTGLGLSIVKHVAATHGGEVRVWSVEGEGSSFTLTLPARVDVDTGEPVHRHGPATSREADGPRGVPDLDVESSGAEESTAGAVASLGLNRPMRRPPSAPSGIVESAQTAHATHDEEAS
jgi:DNA topoisomerase VI subunit B